MVYLDRSTDIPQSKYVLQRKYVLQSAVSPHMVSALYSEGSMFRKYLFKRVCVQKVLYSEGLMFRRFYVQKVLYSEGPMFRRSYVQIYSEGPIFRKFFVVCRKKHTSFSFDL